MSNFLAIATVTATVAQVILAAANAAVSGASVSTRAPDAPALGGSDPRVNLYLYQTTLNAAYRNTDAPTRRADGTLVERPTAAIDLHYLLSFYGDENEFVPQRLLGSAINVLHSQPVLSRDSIRDLIINARYPHTSGEYLKSSDLADSVELIKFTPLFLSLEELSKLWSVMVQTPYTLSIAYQASVVLIQPDLTPRQALPVLSRAIFVHTLGLPVITGIDPQILEFAAGAKITITGSSLNATGAKVTVSGSESPAVAAISATQLTAQLPVGLLAGIQAAQVVHPLDLGTGMEPHKGFQSNIAVFMLTPKISNFHYSPGSPSSISVSVDPEIGPHQRTDLALNSRPGDPLQAYSFSSGGRATATNTVTFAVAGVPAGTYIARLSVDGAATALTVDSGTKLFNGPTVVVT